MKGRPFLGGLYCGNPKVVAYSASTEMQAAEAFFYDTNSDKAPEWPLNPMIKPQNLACKPQKNPMIQPPEYVALKP